ncbi:MAG: hypothetical protein EU549_00730 [Promethearchaeota archaeon]|nr:MAG: hypothetical protein EU549_00730 [Candidatus Lokiarchaeota archaeon]
MPWKKRPTQKEETTYIYPHYHCIVCDKIIEKNQDHIQKKTVQKGVEFVERYCSQECYNEIYKAKKKSKKHVIIKWVSIGGIAAASVIVLLLMLALS